jgi:hypothetical protein
MSRLFSAFQFFDHSLQAAITASLDLIGTRKTGRQFHVSSSNAILGIVGEGAESR